ncbi:MAG: hypothetical protein CML46_15130 [Rhodobacteraceae bacterium]|nr:hypothetical protein [Paracoccaceae bacterium]MBR28256.1 hypothetical protein [Paracoccaceae bacterium]
MRRVRGGIATDGATAGGARAMVGMGKSAAGAGAGMAHDGGRRACEGPRPLAESAGRTDVGAGTGDAFGSA